MRDIEYLAFHRPDESGKLYKGIPMDAEEIRQRRRHIREKLITSSFCKKSDSDLDMSRYYEADDLGFYEDEKGRCYLLQSTINSKTEAEFRKSRAMMPFEYIGLSTRAFDWSVYPADVHDQRRTLNDYILGFGKMLEYGMGLYIFSKIKGSGKTMLSCCILNEIANRYPVLNVKFVNALELLEMTKKGYDGDDSDIRSIYDSSVLVLDDIGVQMTKQWVDTVFYRLINMRYTQRKITIFTSNQSISDLKIDDRIKDRIESRTYLVPLPEFSVRRMKAEQEKDKIMKEVRKENP